jgi:hypothetical protein
MRADFVCTNFQSTVKHSTTWGFERATYKCAEIHLHRDKTLTINLFQRDERVRRRRILGGYALL